MDIQWYPGHMTKARRMIETQIKLVDLVVEIVDARIPSASRNPDFDPLFKTRARIIVLNKADLADRERTKEWLQYYRKNGWLAMAATSTTKRDVKTFLDLCAQAAEQKVAQWSRRGAHKTVRAMVAGIPNVGKSTFINALSGAARTATGDRPGVTRGKQWVNVSSHLELLDTPGLLWPKQEDPAAAQLLAYMGSINDEILDLEQLCGNLLQDLARLRPEAVKTRFKLDDLSLPPHELLEMCSRKRGFLRAGGMVDIQRGARVILDEVRGGKLGPITLERPQHPGKPTAQEAPDGQNQA